MLIKSIEFAHEITDVDKDNVDVFVSTPKDFLEKMDQEKINFVDDHCEKTDKGYCYGSDTSLRRR